MPEEFCPRCGQPRIAMFRYCRSCGLDFDDMSVGAEPPESQPSTGWLPPPKPRRSLRYAAIGVAAFLGLGLLGNLTGAPSSGPDSAGTDPSIIVAPTVTVRQASAVAATQTPTSDGTAGSAPEGNTVEATAVRVIDGDTIVVEVGGAEHRVRYIGVDSPETTDPETGAQWMGAQATEANASLVMGKTVFLEKDVSEVDPFDRLLRHVWLNDGPTWTLVNLELVRQGVAEARSYPPDVRYDALYSAAEGYARVAGLGLWGATPAPPSPSPSPKPTPEPESRPATKPKPTRDCHPSYAGACLKVDAGDYDCAAGSGNGPNYTGLVRVVGPDVFDLDRDGDGLGCE